MRNGLSLFRQVRHSLRAKSVISTMWRLTHSSLGQTTGLRVPVSANFEDTRYGLRRTRAILHLTTSPITLKMVTMQARHCVCTSLIGMLFGLTKPRMVIMTSFSLSRIKATALTRLVCQLSTSLLSLQYGWMLTSDSFRQRRTRVCTS